MHGSAYRSLLAFALMGMGLSAYAAPSAVDDRPGPMPEPPRKKRHVGHFTPSPRKSRYAKGGDHSSSLQRLLKKAKAR